MTVSPAISRRVATALALAAGAALTMTACSAGQIAQTANQVAAINGNGVDEANISLRNVHVLFPNSEEYRLEPGGRAELAFTAINTSEQFPDTLTRITTEGAQQVTLIGSADSVEIPAQASLAAGVPANLQPADPTDPSSTVLVVLEGLTDAVRPGLTVPMTFSFERAGDVVVSVPVDAGLTPRVVNEQSGPAQEEG